MSREGSNKVVAGESGAQCDTKGTKAFASPFAGCVCPETPEFFRNGWHVSHAYTVLLAMSHTFTLSPHRPHDVWLYTYRLVHGSPKTSASSGSTVRMLPLTKPRCISSTVWCHSASKVPRAKSVHDSSGCTPALYRISAR